jgi:hypothetical protein
MVVEIEAGKGFLAFELVIANMLVSYFFLKKTRFYLEKFSGRLNKFDLKTGF